MAADSHGTDTPRTDAFYAAIYDSRIPAEMVEAVAGRERDFARQLERELAEVRAALAGEDFASLPSDFTTVRMAHTIRSERDKFLWQVRDTCARAEKAESARKDAPRD